MEIVDFSKYKMSGKYYGGTERKIGIVINGNDYDDIMQMLRDNSKLVNVDDTISLFWNIYVIDALLGNFDMKKIDTLLDKTIFISETQKEFYRHMIWARYQVILRQSYERLMNGNMI